MADLAHLTLANLGAGAVVEKFNTALRQVLENVLDPNTEAEKKRTIDLVVAFKPSKTRHRAAVEVNVKVKLASSRPFETQAYFGMDPKTGELLVAEDNPDQLTIQDFTQNNDKVEHIDQKRQASGEKE